MSDDNIDLSKASIEIVDNEQPIKIIDIVLPGILTSIEKRPAPDGNHIYIAHIDVVMNNQKIVAGLLDTDDKGELLHLKMINGKEEKKQ